MNHQMPSTQYSVRNFLPLLIIIALIIGATIAKQALSSTYDFASIMYDCMGFFFIVFGFFKAMNLNAFAEAYASYDLIASRSALYAKLYPFIELSLGCAYLARWHLPLINGVTFILMLINAAGVARALARREQFVCACLGVVFKVPMTYVTLFEDLVMALMALIMIIY